MKTYRYEVKLGDWSADGHGITESYMIKTNLERSEIEKCIKYGLEAIGETQDSYTKESLPWCEGYEDSAVHRDVFLKLKTLGLCKEYEIDETDEIEYLHSDTFFYLWTQVLALGAEEVYPNRPIDLSQEEPDDVLHIGGYGLFS